MKYTLDINSYNSYNDNLSFFNSVESFTLNETEEIRNENDINIEAKRELSKWQKIVKWVKSNKTKTGIIIGSLVFMSITISILMRILKTKQINDDVLTQSINNIVTQNTDKLVKKDIEEFIKTLRMPVDWSQYKDIRGFIGKGLPSSNVKKLKDMLASGRYDSFDKESSFDEILKKMKIDKSDLSDDLLNALRVAWADKILSGSETGIYLDKATGVIKNFDPAKQFDENIIPPFWDKSDDLWKIQTILNKEVDNLDNTISKFGDGDTQLDTVDGWNEIIKEYKIIRKKLVVDTAVYRKDRDKLIELYNKLYIEIQKILIKCLELI